MLCVLLMPERVLADWWWPFDDAPVLTQVVVVSEPYVDIRTGPASAYPVIHTSEKGEKLELLFRKTNWMKVSDSSGREGWVNIGDITKTKDLSGEDVAISAPRFDDFTTRRWEAGLMMGEQESSAVNAAYLGYWMTENLSAELWGSQVLGDRSELRIWSLNLLHQPFPSWRYSPFFSLGLGEANIRPKEIFLQPENTKETQVNVGLGLRAYVTDRFFVRAEYKDYKLFTQEDTNEEASEWKLGLSVFF